MRNLRDRLVGVCVALLLAAVALRVIVGLLTPYLPLLAVLTLALVGVVAWRAWQRSRW